VSELSEIARIATVVDNSNKRQWKHRNIYLINLQKSLFIKQTPYKDNKIFFENKLKLLQVHLMDE